MERKRIFILGVVALLSGGVFYIINITTSKPYMTGGNGNPGLLFMVPTIPLYIYMSVLLYNIFFSFFTSSNKSTVAIYTSLSLLLLISLIIGEYYYVQAKLVELNNPEFVKNHRKTLTLLGPFTNNWYFNVYTYFFLPLLAILGSGCQHLFLNKKKQISRVK